MMRRAAMPMLVLLLASDAAWAQTFVSMGRLFTTPSERAQLDQARNSGAALPGAMGGPGGLGGPGVPGFGSGAGTSSTGGAIAPMTGIGGGSPCPAGTVPAGGIGAGGTAGGAGAAGGGGVAGCVGLAEAGGAAAAPEAVRLTGLIRRSSGRSTVFVNDEPQDARVVNQGKAARVNVNGRSVVLKPGQSYDPATGAINEADR